MYTCVVGSKPQVLLNPAPSDLQASRVDSLSHHVRTTHLKVPVKIGPKGHERQCEYPLDAVAITLVIYYFLIGEMPTILSGSVIIVVISPMMGK